MQTITESIKVALAILASASPFIVLWIGGLK